MKDLRCQGLTLIELLVVMTLMAIFAGFVALFARQPIDLYLAASRRTELVDLADGALRRMAREIAQALPNSLRVNVVGGVSFIEFVPIAGAGRFSGLAGSSLDLSAPVGAFNVLGLNGAMAVGDTVVIHNMPPGGAATEANFYLGTNTGVVAAYAAPTLTLTGTTTFPDSWTRRFFVIAAPPVSFVCTPGAAGGTLTRHTGYGVFAAQPTAGLGAGAMLATRVTACTFAYAPVVSQNSGLLSLTLTLSADDESITLMHQIHVNNAP